MTAPRFWLYLTLLGVALATLGADCEELPEEITLYAMTSAPPTRVARIVEQIDDSDPAPFIEISRGVILSVRCWDSCDYTCEEPVLTVSNPDVLAIRSVDRHGYDVPEMALVAVSSGAANLTVTTDCATKTYWVEVRAD